MLVLIYIVFIFGGVLLLFASLKPSTFRVVRRESMRAPAEKIFALVNDLAAWNDWYPSLKSDSGMGKNFSRVTVGKGAGYQWDSEGEAGAGELEITDSVPPTRVELSFEMIEPYQAHYLFDFRIEAMDGYTTVTWAIAGKREMKAKVKSIFTGFDEEEGVELEEGLDNLKRLCEKRK